MSLAADLHVKYVEDLNKHTRDYEFWLSEHLRLNGLYWGLTALFILGRPEALNHDDIVAFALKCLDKRSGGFGAFPGHDGHMLSTLSGLQILAMCGRLHELDAVDAATGLTKKERVVQFVKSNQLPDGSFQGDRYGEVDTRFVYNALSSLSILGELHDDVAAPAADFILRCQNFDGGFGLVPGAESHAAQVFTCLGGLAIAGKLDKMTQKQKDLVAWWLCERQQDNYTNAELVGGLNGRPEKLPDVCYSWWVLSSLAILGRVHWIDGERLQQFILKSQDLERGGIADRPGNEVDVFHTVFGITGLSLLGYPNLVAVDPVYCMPRDITAKFDKKEAAEGSA